MPWLYTHAGYSKVWDKREYNDPAVPRSTAEYMKEAIDKGWIPMRPKAGTDPKVFLFTGSNPLRRWPAPQIALEHLWPKLNLIVDVNFKGGTSGLYADIILPTSGYYERDSIKYSQAYVPYLIMCEKAVEPRGEAKPEWEIFGLLAKAVQERARQRGVSKVSDSTGHESDFSDGLRPVEPSGEVQREGRQGGAGLHPAGDDDHGEERLGGGNEDRAASRRRGRRQVG